MIGIRVWQTETEVPTVRPQMPRPTQSGPFSTAPSLPGASPAAPGNQVQLSVMQVYRITMQSVLRASGCTPRKLNPDEPWSWLLGQLIAAHRIPAPSVHLCWLQWYLQPDIRSLLPEALELVRNKMDVLRGAHLDGFERTQLDALRLDVRHPAPDCRRIFMSPCCFGFLVASMLLFMQLLVIMHAAMLPGAHPGCTRLGPERAAVLVALAVIFTLWCQR